MPVSALILPILAAAAQASDQRINVTGHGWAPFISPMGETFRARSASDDTLARWFYLADRNRDGVLTPDEMQADADRFFATLDTDHNGLIDSEELMAYEQELAPEVQVNTRWMRQGAEIAAEPRPQADGSHKRRRGDEFDGYLMNGPQGAARYALLNIPEPVAGADSDFDRAVTLGEFRQAALQRFQLLDTKRQGKLTLPDLEGLVPTRPRKGYRPKEDSPDARIGLPLPKSN
jgi:Ca2+-binding EF-hand superfamily protein